MCTLISNISADTHKDNDMLLDYVKQLVNSVLLVGGCCSWPGSEDLLLAAEREGGAL